MIWLLLPLPIRLVGLLRRASRVRVVAALFRSLLLVRVAHTCARCPGTIVPGLALSSNSTCNADSAYTPNAVLVAKPLSTEQALQSAALSLPSLAIVVSALHLRLLLSILLLALPLCVQRPRRLGLLLLRLRLLRLLGIHRRVLDKRLPIAR